MFVQSSIVDDQDKDIAASNTIAGMGKIILHGGLYLAQCAVVVVIIITI